MSDPSSYTHEWFMDESIRLALVAKQRGESAVGSIVVKKGEIIGRGIEAGKAHLDITFHAEIRAIREATSFLQRQDLSACTMYTTHEPCIMCSYVVRHTKIGTLVIGQLVPGIGGYSSRFSLLTDRTISSWGDPPVIVEGIRAEQCAALR